MARLNLLPLVGDMPLGKRSDEEILAALEAEIAGLEAVQRAVDDVHKAIDEVAGEISANSAPPHPAQSPQSKHD